MKKIFAILSIVCIMVCNSGCMIVVHRHQQKSTDQIVPEKTPQMSAEQKFYKQRGRDCG